MRRNPLSKARFSPASKRAVLQQRKNYEAWKKRVRYAMRCVVESVISAT